MTFHTLTTHPLQQRVDSHRRSTFKRSLEKGKIRVSTLSADQELTEDMNTGFNNTLSGIVDLLVVDRAESLTSP